MRRILIASVGRSDYGIYRQIMERIDASASLEYALLVSGAHLSRAGHTIDEIRADGRPVAVEIPLPETSVDQGSMAMAMGQAIIGVAEYFSKTRPDILLVLGDRFEMFAIAAAAFPSTFRSLTFMAENSRSAPLTMSSGTRSPRCPICISPQRRITRSGSSGWARIHGV